MNFSNQVVLVAGGTGGLGRAITTGFLAAGARTIATYFIPAEYDSLLRQLNDQQPGNAHLDQSKFEGHQLDVTDEAAVTQLANRIVANYGRLDALVNTVGGYFGGTKLWEMETKDWERMFALNLRAGFVLSRVAVRAMLKQGHGAIVNIASKAAVDHAAGASAYAASKAAAVAMIDCLAADLKGTGVRANSILPSIIDTGANRKAMPGANFAKWPKPEEIARVILWLCGDEAKLVQGASVPVYGDS
jgi:NAD(P)-dependent dehydrogenase (short-subunit alcohol dehydrogenase family)